VISNLRSALRATFTEWRKRRAARDRYAILQRADAYTQAFDLAVDRAVAIADRLEDDEREPAVPLHPLTHQRRPFSPRRYPGAVSLEGAALRLIESEDTGPIPRHFARTGWAQR
jgi:hypothetical protein